MAEHAGGQALEVGVGREGASRVCSYSQMLLTKIALGRFLLGLLGLSWLLLNGHGRPGEPTNDFPKEYPPS